MKDINEILKDKRLNDIDELSETIEVTDTDKPKSKKKNKKSKTVMGTVANCKVLNIRNSPSLEGEVIGVVYAGDKLRLDIVKSTNDFYKVIGNSGGYGYCMRDYVERD
jgi:uncharacterized protein YgiM (DUF1202 family)